MNTTPDTDWVGIMAEVFYDDSPCGSPIEDVFYYEFQKVRAPGSKISRQFKCPTRAGTFYLDFLVEAGGRRVGFECDGKAFHEPHRDSIRDEAIVRAGHADCIYRLRGHDIWLHIAVAFDVIRVRDPLMFSESGHRNIKARIVHCHKTSGFNGNWYRDQPFESGVRRLFERDTKDGGDEVDDDTIVRWTDKPTTPQ